MMSDITPFNIIIVLIAVIVLALLWRWSMAVLDRANGADWGYTWLNRIDGFFRIFVRRYHRFRYEPLYLPEDGPVIVVSNHVSGLDPFLMVGACRRPIRFLIAKEQYERFGLQWLFRAAGSIPVDRTGRPETALRAAWQALERGEAIGLFPHGKIHLDSDPPRKLKRGVVKLAQWSQCPIYPMRIDGIAGEGHTVLAMFIRSRARLRHFAPLYCKEQQQQDDCLAQLAQRIGPGAGEETS